MKSGIKERLCLIVQRFARQAALPVLLGVLLAASGQTAWAHQDPPVSATLPNGCFGNGVGISIFVLRADGMTGVGSGTVSPCETLVFKATLNYQGSPTCAFEGGTWTLTTPDGVVHFLASPTTSPVPCIGGTFNDPNSATDNSGRGLCFGAPQKFPGGGDLSQQTGISYTVRAQDIQNGMVTLHSDYVMGFSHAALFDQGGLGAIAPNASQVMLCPASTPCVTSLCDPTLK